jgi:FlaG/FlaF family flagellin (archaellin)
MFDHPTPRARGLAPLTGVVLVTFALAAVVSGAVLAGGHAGVSGDLSPRASLSLSVAGDTLTLTHRGGDALDVTALRLVVTVDGGPLTHQPPVPFFSTRGFDRRADGTVQQRRGPGVDGR